MPGFIDKLNENPVYQRELLYLKKESIKKKHIPHWIPYLIILTAPLLFGLVYSSFSEIKIEDLGNLFNFSLFLQLCYFTIMGFESTKLFAREKEQKTYQNLISTPMKPSEIVLGKFWFIFFPLAKELTLFFPLTLILGVFFLKLNYIPLVLIYILTLVFTALSTITGLYFSAISSDPNEAGNNCYKCLFPLMMLINLFPFLIMMLFFLEKGKIGWILSPYLKPLWEVIMAVNPLSILMDLLSWDRESGFTRSLGGFLRLSDSPFILLLSLFLYLLAFVLIFRKVSNIVGEVPGDNAKEAKTNNESEKKEPERKKAPAQPILPFFREKHFLPAFLQSLFDNPVFLKDNIINIRRNLNMSPKERKKQRKNTILFFVIIILINWRLIAAIAFNRGENLHYLFHTMTVLISFIIMKRTLFASYFLNSEKTKGTYDNLVSTMLSPGEIVTGKFWFTLYPALRNITLYYPLIFILGIFAKIPIPGLFALYILIVAAGAYFTIAGLYSAFPPSKEDTIISKALYHLNIPLFFVSLFLSGFVVDTICRSLNLISLPVKEHFYNVYPLTELYFQGDKNITGYGMNPALALSTAALVVIFLAIIIPIGIHIYKKAVAKVSQVPGK